MYPEKGTFLAADRQIDPKTGTIRISATFPNPQQLLRPGQYGRVSADTRTLRKTPCWCRSARSPSCRAARRCASWRPTAPCRSAVTLGERIGIALDRRRAGSQAGDRVIVDSGQLAAGTKVTTKPFVEPTRQRAGTAPRRRSH